MKTTLTALMLLLCSVAHAVGESDSDYRQRLIRERDAREAQEAANAPKYETRQQRAARLHQQQRDTPAYLYDGVHDRVRWVGPRSSNR
jgi:hypothetical protein